MSRCRKTNGKRVLREVVRDNCALARELAVRRMYTAHMPSCGLKILRANWAESSCTCGLDSELQRVAALANAPTRRHRRERQEGP